MPPPSPPPPPPTTPPPPGPLYTISPANTPTDLTIISTLFTAYTTWLDIDLTFQNYAAELSSLPGAYSLSAGGVLLLARRAADNAPLGCVAMRAMGINDAQAPAEKVCEMKRLYVSPEGRGMGVGRALVEEVIRRAKGLGYSRMRLDTLAGRMEGAMRLYEGYGFRRIEAYYRTPLVGTVFLERDLSV